MHKSVMFTFGLLMSSLVMLSAVPILNNNTVAMAQGYGYDNYYGDSNSYYSQYPTDDKKYECRTGPFEGFFVSSVEFCKSIKFDKDKDRKDNRTGTQGPAGPAGPIGATGPQGIQGPPGAQGPSGITQLNATNVYSVNNSTTSTPPQVFAFSFALCDPGDLVLNGGYNLLGSAIEDNDTASTVIDQAISNPTVVGVGWIAAVVVNEETSSITLNVNALCFDNPPLRP